MSSRTKLLVFLLLLFEGAVAWWALADEPRFDAAEADRFFSLALACVHKEYPNKISHVLSGDADVKPPRDLTPAFFGCFDWHSAVHAHWLLARLARTFPKSPSAAKAREALEQSLSPAHLAAEAAYVKAQGRATFERPYGLAWLMQLCAELDGWDDPQARIWRANLKPLESAAAERLKNWLPKLSKPLRDGEHKQTAFAFGLILDWARATGDKDMQRLIEQKTEEFYLKDRACPMAYELSGEDFLSPCLGEADLMRRTLPPEKFAKWLSDFLPGIPEKTAASWLEPAVVTDPSDGRLAHLAGLNLSRAWMLEGIAAGLPAGDKRLAALHAVAASHREAGLKYVTAEHYEGGHWLGTFAAYLESRSVTR